MRCEGRGAQGSNKVTNLHRANLGAVGRPLRRLARALVKEFGQDRAGGVYYDKAGRLVVAVTDESAAREVRARGGVAKVVKHSTATLDSVRATLDRRIADVDPIPNTSWGVDPSTNKVTVEVFDGVSAADEKRLKRLVARYGDAVRVDRLPGKIDATAYETLGGIGIESSDVAAGRYSACTLGFNVRDASGQKYFVTAGHCADSRTGARTSPPTEPFGPPASSTRSPTPAIRTTVSP